MLQRYDVIGRFLAMFPSPSYLEIGVSQGETFNRLHAARKVAVDPLFQFDTAAYASETVRFFPVPSDEFFARVAPTLPRYDVIYLDGLHTYEQTLRDLLNAAMFLNEKGVIIIDDVLPTSYDASLPDLAEVGKLRGIAPAMGVNWFCDGSWMGDVFKVTFFVQSFMQQFSYATVAEHHGQTVLWRQTRAATEVGLRNAEQISRLDYRDTIVSRADFKVAPFPDIIARVTAALA